MRIKNQLLCTAIIAIAGISSANVSAQGLRDAVAVALESHPSVDGAHLSYKAAEQGRAVEKSKYFPEISTRMAAGRIYQDNSTSRGLVNVRGAAYSGLGEASLRLDQMMFDGFEVTNRVNASDARMKSLSYNVQDVEDSLALRVAQSYVDTLRVRNAIKLLSKQAGIINDYKRRIEEMVIDGAADEAELQQARDVVMMVNSARAEYDGQLLSANAAYMEAVGETPPRDLDDALSVKSFINEDITDAVTAAKVNHPSLQSARLDSKAARHDMKVEQARMYPDINGELSYSKVDKDDDIGGESKDARAVIHMNWGFSTGRGAFSSVKQKRFKHYEATANYKALEREIERDIFQSYASYATLKRTSLISAERAKLNQKLLNSYKDQFEGARIGLLSLMRAENQLFSAKLENLNNKYYLLSSEYSILASLGQLKDTIISGVKED